MGHFNSKPPYSKLMKTACGCMFLTYMYISCKQMLCFIGTCKFIPVLSRSCSRCLQYGYLGRLLQKTVQYLLLIILLRLKQLLCISSLSMLSHQNNIAANGSMVGFVTDTTHHTVKDNKCSGNIPHCSSKP